MRISSASLPDTRQTAEAFQRQLRVQQDAATQAGQKRTDPAELPFHIVMEVKSAPAAQANRALAGCGFMADTAPPDCSHDFSGGSGSYTRISSSPTTIAKGGLQQIGDALERLTTLGATVGRTCAMRIYFHGALGATETGI